MMMIMVILSITYVCVCFFFWGLKWHEQRKDLKGGGVIQGATGDQGIDPSRVGGSHPWEAGTLSSLGRLSLIRFFIRSLDKSSTFLGSTLEGFFC